MDLAARIREWARAPCAWTFFFGTTFIVFASFFLEGKVLLSSTDQTWNHYPNILFGYRMLRQGDFGLWNPLIFGGVDFSSSFHHHMLHPLNWPLLLLPERFVLHGVTLQCYLELSLLGIFAFQTIRRVQDDDLIALFVALVAQLGGFAWFTTTTLIGTHLLVAAAAAIYVIVSHTSRRPVLNYLCLALCFFDMLMMGHVAYISAFGLPVVIVFFWWTWPEGVVRPWRGLMPAVVLAFVTACCLSAVRVWPVMHGMLFEQSFASTMALDTGDKDAGYLALTGFVPEMFGLHHDDSNLYASGIATNGRHTQFHNLLYYGIMPILLVWLSILRGLGSRSFGLAAIYLAVALTPLNLVQILSDVVNIAIFPVHHVIICRTGGMFLLCAALVPILRELRDRGVEPDDWRLRWFLALVGIVLACCMALIVRASQVHPNLAAGHPRAALVATKVLILAGLPACFVMVGRMKLNSTTTARLTRGAIVLFWLAVVVLGAVALRRGYFWHSWFTFRGFAYTAANGLWAIFTVGLARTLVSNRTLTRWQWRLLIGTGVAALLICLVPISEHHGPRGEGVLLLSGALSMVKFVLMACVALEIVVLCGATPAGRRQLLPLLCLLTLGELEGQTKLYGHVGSHPFINAADLYPRKNHWEREHADWLASANGPNFLTNSSLQSVGASVPGWTTGGSHSTAQPTASGVKIAAGAQDGVTLFQDVTLPEPVEALTMGAWVRSTSGVPVNLLLATSDKYRKRHYNVESQFYTGQGSWEWLTATVAHEGTANARPHVVVSGNGEAEVTGLLLVTGVASRASPRPAGEVHVTPALVRAEQGQFGFNDIQNCDTKSYRINKPTHVLRWQDSDVVPNLNAEFASNINMVYQAPTYVGVDSDVKTNLVTLINAFDGNPPNWNPRGGIAGILTNPRLLDILGVKYDWDNQELVVRPDALARLSLFEHFEVHSDRKAMLERLKQSDFDPAQSIVIDGQPPQTPGTATRFQPVGFESHGSSRLTAQINLKQPAVLLFNDGYSKYWECTCNGQPLPVMTANGNFMAVALPAGSCQLEWAFRPAPVLLLFRVSFAASLLLAGVAVWAALSRKQTGSVKETPLPAMPLAA